MESFSALNKWLSEIPDQTKGDAAAICQTGEPYLEFLAYAISRPNDRVFIEREVARQMHSKLEEYFTSRSGTLYWRIPFESEIKVTDVVIRYDENGPDIDFVTDRKCFKDLNWVRVACYCRLYKATHRAIERHEAAA